MPKGTKDILPSEIYKWQYVDTVFANVCGQFLCREMRTPTFEHTELFERGVGDETDIVQKEMYTFKDKGGRSITLRPEGTAGVVRSYIQNGMSSLPQPVKLYYNINAFRYEKMQKGRYREFNQLGVEVFGANSFEADVDVISLCQTFFNRLGLSDVRLNINSLGCGKCRKVYSKKLSEYLGDVVDKLCETCKGRHTKNPLRIFDCKEESCKKYLASAPTILDSLCDECGVHFEEVKNGLDSLNIKYVIDKWIVRGLDYYTKTVFEFTTSGLGSQSTICGGGRYDGLVEACGGPPTPAVGFALGVERLLMTMDSQKIAMPNGNCADVYVATVGKNASDYMRKMVHNAREQSSCRVEMDVMNRSLKAQMKYAHKIGAQYCLIVGDEEVRKGAAQLRNMKSGEQREVSIKDDKCLIDIIGPV